MSCVGCCHILIHKLLCPARTCVESESIPYRYMLFRPRTFEPRLAYTPHGFSQRNSRGRRSALGGGGGGPGGRCPAGPGRRAATSSLPGVYSLFTEQPEFIIYPNLRSPHPTPRTCGAAAARPLEQLGGDSIGVHARSLAHNPTFAFATIAAAAPRRLTPTTWSRLLSDGAALVRLSRSPSGVSFPLPPRVSVGDRHTQIAGCGMSSRHRLCPGHAHLDDCDSA